MQPLNSRKLVLKSLKSKIIDCNKILKYGEDLANYNTRKRKIQRVKCRNPHANWAEEKLIGQSVT